MLVRFLLRIRTTRCAPVERYHLTFTIQSRMYRFALQRFARDVKYAEARAASVPTYCRHQIAPQLHFRDRSSATLNFGFLG